MFKRLLCVVVCVLTIAPLGRAEPDRRFLNGIDSNYALDMEKGGKTWSCDARKTDPFVALAEAGADGARIRLWTGDEGVNGLAYATETARRAQAAGLKPYLVIFLSENWSDMVKQPLPAIWKDLGPADKLAAIEAYSERVVRHFVQNGVEMDLFEIGNEIDFGICGEFVEEWPQRVSMEFMRAHWKKMAPMIVAAQRGVKKVRPDAKFILHLAQWNKPDYCIAFWQTMLASGAAVDFPGLSYFPTSAAEPAERTLAFFGKQIDAIHTALNRPTIICEYAYPSQAKFGGQFGDWDKPIEGYTLDPQGQATWLRDFVQQAQSNPKLAGIYYWSPEWYVAGMWEAFSLFDAQGNARPALQSLKPAPATQPATQPAAMNIYFGNLHAHTAISDGKGTAAEAFAYARDTAKLDFLALTEHNHLMGGDKATPEKRTALYAGPGNEALIPAANRFNQDGKFVAFYGQEFSSMSKGNHVNVFDIKQVIDIPNGDFGGLLKWMDQHRDSSGQLAILQFNHPGLGPPNKKIDKNEYGRDDFGDDAGWIKQIGEVTSLIEVLNGEAAPKLIQKRSSQIMEEHYRLYLQLGFRLAPVGNQDNHETNWGTATDTRTGIIAPALTRSDLLAAMRARHVYASEDKNLKLIFRVNGQLAGDVLSSPTPLNDLKIEYQIDDPDEPQADYTIDVFSGTIGGPLAEVIQTVNTKGNGAGNISNLKLTDDGQYLYFRITQKDKITDRAWTAPVWLKISAK